MPLFDNDAEGTKIELLLSTLSSDRPLLRVDYLDPNTKAQTRFGFFKGTDGSMGKCLILEHGRATSVEIPFGLIARIDEIRDHMHCFSVLNALLNDEQDNLEFLLR